MRIAAGAKKKYIHPYKQIYQFPELSVFQIGLWCHDRINKKTRVIGYNAG